MSTIDMTQVAGLQTVDAEGNVIGTLSVDDLTNLVANNLVKSTQNQIAAARSVSTMSEASTLAASDDYENTLPIDANPASVRTLDSEGNPKQTGISAFAQVVGGLLGVNSIVSVGQEKNVNSINYVNPNFVLGLPNLVAGDKTFTLAIANKNINSISKYYSFNIHQTPGYNQNSAAGWAHVEYCSNSAYSSLSSIVCGNVKNIREGVVGGKNVVLADVIVKQYGRSDIYITGMHPDVAEIKDVTGEI